MKKPPVIMLVGKTHVGKTKFATQLKGLVPDLLILEADPIRIFLADQFPEIAKSDKINAGLDFKRPAINFQIFHTIVERALELENPIILSNSNLYAEGRRRFLDLCKSHDRATVGVYIDLPIELLEARTKATARDSRVLRTSRDFAHMLERQADRIELPSANEFNEFEHVHSQEEYGTLIERFAERLS